MEPLLERVHLNQRIAETDIDCIGMIDWIIVGGESGYKKDARTMSLEAVELVLFQANMNGSNFFFKQLGVQLAKQYKLTDDKGGNFEEYPKHLQWLTIREIPCVFPNHTANKNPIDPTLLIEFKD